LFAIFFPLLVCGSSSVASDAFLFAEKEAKFLGVGVAAVVLAPLFVATGFFAVAIFLAVGAFLLVVAAAAGFRGVFFAGVPFFVLATFFAGAIFFAGAFFALLLVGCWSSSSAFLFLEVVAVDFLADAEGCLAAGSFVAGDILVAEAFLEAGAFLAAEAFETIWWRMMSVDREIWKLHVNLQKLSRQKRCSLLW
jgi:hypothetical protein